MFVNCFYLELIPPSLKDAWEHDNKKMEPSPISSTGFHKSTRGKLKIEQVELLCFLT